MTSPRRETSATQADLSSQRGRPPQLDPGFDLFRLKAPRVGRRERGLSPPAFVIGHLPQHPVILLEIEPQRGKRLGSQRRPARMKQSGWRMATVEMDLMRKPILALLVMLLAGLASAHGSEVQVGRYQMIAVPASQSQTFPQTLLMDTATGQTWILYHETGQSIEWLPLRFSAGKDRPATPLPPSPDAVGVSR